MASWKPSGATATRAMIKLWRNAWEEFMPFLDYDIEIRKIICSTNAIWRSTPGIGEPCGLGDISPTSSSIEILVSCHQVL
jgi:transposase-like protein